MVHGEVPLAINSPRTTVGRRAPGAAVRGLRVPRGGQEHLENTMLARAAATGNLSHPARDARRTDHHGRCRDGVNGVGRDRRPRRIGAASSGDGRRCRGRRRSGRVGAAAARQAGATESRTAWATHTTRSDATSRDTCTEVRSGSSTTKVNDLVGPGPSISTHEFRHGNDGLVGGGMLANEFVPHTTRAPSATCVRSD